MTINEFWAIVDRVHVASDGDMNRKCKLLADELHKFPAQEVKSFGKHFGDYFYHAYSYPLWDAAALICGGCSDDSFMDFRSTLISMGKTTFENALVNPDSLADTDMNSNSACYEGYQYVVGNVLKRMSVEPDGCDVEPHPRTPTGQRTNEWEMSHSFPRLAAKFHYDDSKYLYLKEKRERTEQRRQFAEYLANLLLDVGIVAPNGFIPPLRVLKEVMRAGQSPEQTGKNNLWEPFELDEEVYWSTVMLLERMPALQILEKGLKVGKLTQDVNAPPSDDFAVWMLSLQDRKLL